MLAHPDSEQLVDLGFDLRRRRYGTSHGVGLLHCLGGREGTYAVALTASADLQQLRDAAGERDQVQKCVGSSESPASTLGTCTETKPTNRAGVEGDSAIRAGGCAQRSQLRSSGSSVKR